MEDMLDVRMPPKKEEDIIDTVERETIPKEVMFKEPVIKEVTLQEPKKKPEEIPSSVVDQSIPELVTGEEQQDPSVVKPVKKKRVISDKQKEHLKLARQKASEKRKLLKQQRMEAKANTQIKENPSEGVSEARTQPQQQQGTSLEIDIDDPNQYYNFSRNDITNFISEGINKYEKTRKKKKDEKLLIQEKERIKVKQEQEQHYKTMVAQEQNHRLQKQKASLVQNSVMKGQHVGQPGQHHDPWSVCF